jgi:cytochrome b
MAYRVRVWDLPTRLFHWLLVACITGSFVSGYIGGAAIDWHARFGYAALALVIFRLAWGLAGGRWSRFSSFLYAPRSVVAYLRGQAHPDHLVGHNPLGAGSVFAILLVLLLQIATGLVNDDEISFQGPLYGFVSGKVASAARAFHEVGQLLLLALIVLHIGAVLFYLVKKRQNLVRPMISGDKEMAHDAPSSRDDWTTRLAAAVLLALSAGLVTWLVRLGTV